MSCHDVNVWVAERQGRSYEDFAYCLKIRDEEVGMATPYLAFQLFIYLCRFSNAFLYAIKVYTIWHASKVRDKHACYKGPLSLLSFITIIDGQRNLY